MEPGSSWDGLWAGVVFVGSRGINRGQCDLPARRWSRVDSRVPRNTVIGPLARYMDCRTRDTYDQVTSCTSIIILLAQSGAPPSSSSEEVIPTSSPPGHHSTGGGERRRLGGARQIQRCGMCREDPHEWYRHEEAINWHETRDGWATCMRAVMMTVERLDKGSARRSGEVVKCMCDDYHENWKKPTPPIRSLVLSSSASLFLPSTHHVSASKPASSPTHLPGILPLLPLGTPLNPQHPNLNHVRRALDRSS